MSNGLLPICLALLLWNVCAGADETTKQPPPKDLYGDPLPLGAIARLGTVQLRHAGVSPGRIPLAFSRDSKTLISASDGDRKIRVFDAATGKLTAVRSLEPVAERYWPHLVLSSDGSTLAAQVAAQGIYVWKTGSTDAPQRIEAEPLGNFAIALSANGRLLAIANHKFVGKPNIQIWDLTTGRTLWPAIPEKASQLVFSGDAKRLAAIEREAVKIYDVETGKELRRFAAVTRGWSDRHVAFSPDGKLLAIRLDAIRLDDEQSRVELWELETGKTRAVLSDQRAPVVFSPDGKLLATLGPERIQLWDPAAGSEVRKKNAPRGYAFVFAPDGKSLAFRWHAALGIWNLETDRVLTSQNGHTSDVARVVFSPDGKWLASEADSIRLWEVTAGKTVAQFPGIEYTDAILTFSPDSKTLLADPVPGTLRRWEVPAGRERTAFDASELGSPFRLRASTDSTMLLTLEHRPGARPRLIRRWDLATGKELWRGDEEALFPEAVSHDGKIRPAAALAALNAPAPTKFGFGQERPVVNFSADGRVLAVMLDTAHPGTVPDIVRFAPPGLDVWDTVSGGSIRRLPVSPSCRLALSHSGRYLATAGLDTLSVFDLADGKEILRRPASEHYRSQYYGDPFATSLAFAPDGKTLATGLSDGAILIWGVFPDASRMPPDKMTTAELDRLWSDLAEHASKGCIAQWKLAEASDAALPHLKSRLQPAAALDAKLVAQLIADLGSDRFAVRDKAFQELRRVGERLEPFLQKSLEQNPSLELRRRAEALLAANPNPEVLRRIRAIAVLEDIGTGGALDILEPLARGDASARETWEAQRAVARVRQRLALHTNHDDRSKIP
jgi:WD40 repeat protein